ncbi:DNA mismatch repair protein MutS [Xylocopilactobacillus apis]|uniref:DNA mismatch repair protein MutS n=1 Tax=Xylocopilactobacillus apis TaxID=2932183 RepID=A0AAU9CS34_9LACO|nr:DNA mismatch repair protein MutS [Xylocopilactobacillus apis]BDR56759.1 DNA mismatch repair protein MutS [Xylocopilactobacillus apis]
MPQKVSDSPMMRQYREIKEIYPDAFLFFRVGDFYEMFYDDAVKGSQLLELTLTSRSKSADEQIPMCGVPHHAIDKYLSELTEMGYKAALCDQVEDPKSSTGPTVKREVTQVVTPGTYISDQDLTNNNYLSAILIGVPEIGLAYADLSTGELKYTKFSNLNAAIYEVLGLNSREIVTINSNSSRIKKALANRKLTISETSFKPEKKDVSKDALNLLLSYIKNTQMRSLSNLNDPKYYEPEEFLSIDYASKQNLELTRSLREGKKYGSLFWALDKTSTTMGSRLLRNWIERPLLDSSEIQKRQGYVGALLKEYVLRSDLKEELKKVYDLEHLSSKIAFGNINAREMTMLKKALQEIPKIKASLNDSSEQVLKDYSDSLESLSDIAELIERSIKEDAPIVITEGDIICDGYDAQLDKYRDSLTGGRNWIAQMEAHEKERTGISKLKVGYNRVFGYYIEVSRVNQGKVPDNYQRKQTLANAERYITPELKEHENLILSARDNSAKLEYEIFNQIRDQIKNRLPEVQKLAAQIAKLDVLNTFSEDAEKNHYVKPVINQKREIQLVESRHPVVELSDSMVDFVPNDVLMPEDNEITIITGPNMSGKSTYMRQLGLIVIMAQIGSFVPADKAELPLFDQIFTRIGASDNLLTGESTFMVEMKEANRALQESTSNSLILMDEIGRGTATYDGMAIAIAIIKYLSENVHAKTLFSTHYHELTQLSAQMRNLNNKHVGAVLKKGKLIFIHKMMDGPSDRSYGVHVAQLAGLPKQVVKDAFHYLREFEKTSTISPTNHFSQENLFYQDNIDDNDLLPLKELAQKIQAVDLNNLTPIEAMNVIADLQKEVNQIDDE